MTRPAPLHQPPGVLTIDRAVNQLHASPSAVTEAISRALVRNYGSDKAGTIADAIVKACQKHARAERMPARDPDAPFIDCDAAGDVDPRHPDPWGADLEPVARGVTATLAVGAVIAVAGLAWATGGWLPFAGGW